jgi:predicted nuclease of predicted toxin-antitoxin system
MKFLVDECLSPKLAQMARDSGHHESSHVVWLGKSGIQDWNLVSLAVDGDWTLVTRNSFDFRGPTRGEGGHYRHVPLHAGLVCLNGDEMDRNTQSDLFAAVLDAVAGDGDLVNQALEATHLENGDIEIVRYELPVNPP